MMRPVGGDSITRRCSIGVNTCVPATVPLKFPLRENGRCARQFVRGAAQRRGPT